jgi:hypothetical protein
MSDVPHRPRKRETVAINVAVGDRSSINYIMPMVVGPSGYESTLEVHLDTVAIRSSLNDIRLVSAESCRVFSSPHSALQSSDTFLGSLRISGSSCLGC